ncbi:MAG: DoxX family protein [Bacterioplanes sp.]|nr:DoxX family protein [Bacterioplanes sp.]
MKVTIISIVLALIFFASGAAKLASLEFEIVAFERWGYALWFMYAIGAIEVIGAVGLLLKRVSALASAGLAVMMIGAIATHVMHAEWGMLAAASVIFALSVTRALLGRDDLVVLFAGKRLLTQVAR